MSSDQHQPPFRPWKVIERREVFSVAGRLGISIEAVELPDGRRIDDYLQIHVADFVLIFAETAAGQVVCLRLYRHGVRGVGLELPTGHIDDLEAPLDAARRELLEETGYESTNWQPLGSFLQSTNHRIGTGHVFCARNATKMQEPNSGDLEESRVELLTHEELVTALRGHQIVSGSCLAAIALALI